MWAPDGNVEFVVGAGAGGENDRIARAIQHALTKEHLVHSMTVLNRPGAAQTIAISYLAGKKGDANAIGLASGSFINAIARSGSTLHKNVTPLMKLFDAYQCYFAKNRFPDQNHGGCARSAAGRSDLGDVRIPGRPWQPAACVRGQCRQGGRRGAEQVITVVCNSGADVSGQVAGGHVDVGITSIGSAMPLIAAGKLRMLGIASPERIDGALASYPRCASRA